MFGIFLTPVFYVLLRGLTGNKPFKQHGEVESEHPIQPRHELSVTIAPTSSTRGRELAKAD
jgi:hypothetical protein